MAEQRDDSMDAREADEGRAMADLERRAEAIVRAQDPTYPENAGNLSIEDAHRLFHQLRVHQVALEIQNDDLRHAQKKIDAARARYFELYDQAPVGYCSLNTAGVIEQANLTAADLFGVSRSELVGQPISRFVLPEDHRVFESHRQQLMETGEPQACDLHLMRADGTDFWGRLTSAASHEIDGPPTCRIVLNDITERKRMLEEMREQKEFFHLIAENIGDFIAVLDLDGRRVYNSPSYIQFFGSKRDLRGSDSFAEIHPDDRERVKNAFQDTVRSGRGRQLEYRMLLGDGSVRIMESRGSVIRDPAGRVARVVVVSHDITERKHMESQVRQMAFHDALTQLPNRRLLNDRLSQTMAASARSGYYGALMFLDLDNFKPLNDRHGHDVGDLLLIEVAERLKGCVREMDTVARFGGDEFVVMISELSPGKDQSHAEAGIIAEKIRRCLAEPYRLTVRRKGRADETVEHPCTATIGVVLFIDHEASQAKILKWADTAMYRAKESGRNAVRFADPKVDDTA